MGDRWRRASPGAAKGKGGKADNKKPDSQWCGIGLGGKRIERVSRSPGGSGQPHHRQADERHQRRIPEQGNGVAIES